VKNMTALLTVATVVGLGYLNYTQYTQYQQAQTELATAQSELETTRLLAEQLPLEEARQKKLQLEATALQQTLPDREELAKILADLRQLAGDTQLNLAEVTRSISAGPLPGINAVNLNLKLSGPYQNVQGYLDALNITRRAITVKTAKLNVLTSQDLNSELAIVTYARNVPKPPTPPPGAVTDPAATTDPASTPPTDPATTPGGTP